MKERVIKYLKNEVKFLMKKLESSDYFSDLFIKDTILSIELTIQYLEGKNNGC